jgi:hypothetical protein
VYPSPRSLRTAIEVCSDGTEIQAIPGCSDNGPPGAGCADRPRSTARTSAMAAARALRRDARRRRTRRSVRLVSMVTSVPLRPVPAHPSQRRGADQGRRVESCQRSPEPLPSRRPPHPPSRPDSPIDLTRRSILSAVFLVTAWSASGEPR